MKTTLVILAFLFWSVPSIIHAQKEDNNSSRQISLMTYNLKFASPTYKPSWEVRREMQVDLIRKYKPDIIGTQEGLKEQIDYLTKQLPEYVVVGEGRQGGDDDEHMAIFYKRDKFRLRELQSFQLSKTPDIIGSGPKVNPRMVTWARFALINISNKGKDGKYPEDYRGNWENTQEFYVFNTHYFNGRKDSLARLNASKLILNRINERNRFGEWTTERPVFLMGDFNCHPASEPHKVLVGDIYSNDTNQLHDPNKENSKEIDWILYKGAVNIMKYEEIDYNMDGVYPSDHKPIYIEFEILNRK